MARLAGQRIDVATNDNFNSRNFIGLALQDIKSGKIRDVRLPDNADIADQQWSPDGRYVAFTNTGTNGMALWVLDTKSGRARELLENGLNVIYQEPRWLPDGKILVLTIPEDRGLKPSAPLTPKGPAIQDAAGGEQAQTRTYQDLLKDPYDEELYAWLVTSQPMIMDVKGRDKKKIGTPRIYTDARPSPDGKYLLMEWLEKPFSYQVPYYRFPLVSEVWNLQGQSVASIARQPLADSLPVQGVVTGPRNITWHPTEDNLLLWAEALDGGDPRTKTKQRDKMMSLAAPFTGNANEVAVFEDRFSGFLGLSGNDDLLTYDYDRDTREVRTSLIDITGSNAPRVIEVRNFQDSYNDPGDPIRVLTEAGFSVAHADNGHIFLSGNGATPEGSRPFLRRFNLTNFET